MLIGSTVVYRGQVGAARLGAVRVRVVMSSAVWGVAVVDGEGDGVPGVVVNGNSGVWMCRRWLGEVGLKKRREKAENGDVEGYLLTSRRGRRVLLRRYSVLRRGGLR